MSQKKPKPFEVTIKQTHEGYTYKLTDSCEFWFDTFQEAEDFMKTAFLASPKQFETYAYITAHIEMEREAEPEPEDEDAEG